MASRYLNIPNCWACPYLKNTGARLQEDSKPLCKLQQRTDFSDKSYDGDYAFLSYTYDSVSNVMAWELDPIPESCPLPSKEEL